MAVQRKRITAEDIKKSALGQERTQKIQGNSGVSTGYKVSTLPISSLKFNDNNDVFRSFDNNDESEEFKNLCNSIEKDGLYNPIWVKDNNNGTYTILAGERRVRAFKALKKSAIPAFVKKEIDDTDAIAMLFVDNLNRRQLTADQQLKAYQQLRMIFERNGEHLSNSRAAEIMNISQRSIERLKKFIKDTSENYLEKFYNGEISYDELKQLSKNKALQTAKENEVLYNYAKENNIIEGVEISKFIDTRSGVIYGVTQTSNGWVPCFTSALGVDVPLSIDSCPPRKSKEEAQLDLNKYCDVSHIQKYDEHNEIKPKNKKKNIPQDEINNNTDKNENQNQKTKFSGKDITSGEIVTGSLLYHNGKIFILQDVTENPIDGIINKSTINGILVEVEKKSIKNI